MSTVKELIASLKPDETFFSLEFFPPKTKTVSFYAVVGLAYLI
jgi:hypothetical protein